MSKAESGRELECGGFVVWWSLFLRKQHKRLELCCPPSNISCFHMAEFCTRVAYVSVRVRFPLFFFISVLYFTAHFVFPELMGRQAVVSDSFMPEC